MGIVVESGKQHRYKMKLLIVAFLIPFVYGDCPPPPKDPVVCTGSDIMCGGEADENGCPGADYCVPKDSFCNFYCGPNEMTCPGNNGDGTCLPMPQNCMPQCPMQCGEDQMLCPQAPVVKDVQCMTTAS